MSAGDDYVYRGFGAGGLAAIAQLAGPAEARVDATVVLDWHAHHGDTDTGEDASRLTSTAKRGRPKQCRLEDPASWTAALVEQQKRARRCCRPLAPADAGPRAGALA